MTNLAGVVQMLKQIDNRMFTAMNDAACTRSLSEGLREGESIKCEQKLVIRRDFLSRNKADGDVRAIKFGAPAAAQHQSVQSDVNLIKSNDEIENQLIAATLERSQIRCARTPSCGEARQQLLMALLPVLLSPALLANAQFRRGTDNRIGFQIRLRLTSEKCINGFIRHSHRLPVLSRTQSRLPYRLTSELILVSIFTG